MKSGVNKLLSVFFSASFIIFNGCNYDMTVGSHGSNVPNDSYTGTEKSEYNEPNSFVLTEDDDLSTFGLDVDNASYTFHRKKITLGSLPSPEAVRVEEFVNYFAYNYPEPSAEETFSLTAETVESPFRDSIVNLRIGLKGKEVPQEMRKTWNLTFLIDISGSMSSRLYLVKNALNRLVDSMDEGDILSVGTYAGSVSTVLSPTKIDRENKNHIKNIISDLQAGGGTAMNDGMMNAYSMNSSAFVDNGVNRVIVCSDGDANIGNTSWDGILNQVEEYKDQGITLTTLGFGTGNYQDGMMEMLANRGNGNYYYVDSEAEATRLFTGELVSVMSVIARDARIQVQFNSTAVHSYRLLGYENRDIDDDAFNDDTTDAGEVGEGHTVTALYELKLNDNASDLGTISLNYKADSDELTQRNYPITYVNQTMNSVDESFRLAVVVGEYADILRNSPYTETTLSQLDSRIDNWPIGNSEEVNEFRTLLKTAITYEN